MLELKALMRGRSGDQPRETLDSRTFRDWQGLIMETQQ